MTDISNKVNDRSRIDCSIREEEQRLFHSLRSKRTYYSNQDDIALTKARERARSDFRYSSLKVTLVFLGVLGTAIFGQLLQTWGELSRIYDVECLDEDPFKTVDYYGKEISCQTIKDNLPDFYLE